MYSPVINGQVLEMLAAMEEVMQMFGIEFYLVGAIARDICLSGNPRFAPQRKTNDVDIAVMLKNEEEFYLVKNALLTTGKFTAHETEAIKLYYYEAIELDLMPFGEIENNRRETRLEQPRLFVLDVPGFREIFPDTESYSIDNGYTLKVCPLEGLVLLKLIAQDDRPGRTKDLSDIDHIIKVYFDLKDQEIYAEHFDVLDLYNVEDPQYLILVSSRVIGKRIGQWLAESVSLRDRILEILKRKTSEVYWAALEAGILDVPVTNSPAIPPTS